MAGGGDVTRPEDIPEDVWSTASDEALKYVEWIDPPHVDGVAAAEHVLAVSFSRIIMAERERCAALAETYDHRGMFALGHLPKGWEGCRRNIAAAIRKGSQ